MRVALRVAVSVLAAVLLPPAHCLSADASRTWRKDHLDDGQPYWWRPAIDGGEPEVAWTKPDEVWNLGRMDNGAPFLWRKSAYGGVSNPELQIWERSMLDDGRPYWWRPVKGGKPEVVLSDPHEFAEPDSLFREWGSMGCEWGSMGCTS